MASLGHVAVGAALGALYSRKTGSNPKTSIIAFAGLALVPDLDLLGSLWNVPHGTALSHRGFTHSLTFAVLVAAALASLIPGRGTRRLMVGCFVLAALASHGLLDTMSQHGDGPMLLWPFSLAHYEFIWRPIPGVLSAGHYLTLQAVPTLVIEATLFLPFILFALITFFPRRAVPPAIRDPVT